MESMVYDSLDDRTIVSQTIPFGKNLITRLTETQLEEYVHVEYPFCLKAGLVVVYGVYRFECGPAGCTPWSGCSSM